MPRDSQTFIRDDLEALLTAVTMGVSVAELQSCRGSAWVLLVEIFLAQLSPAKPSAFFRGFLAHSRALVPAAFSSVATVP